MCNACYQDMKLLHTISATNGFQIKITNKFELNSKINFRRMQQQQIKSKAENQAFDVQ